MKGKRLLALTITLAVFLVCFVGISDLTAQANKTPVAEVIFGSNGVSWTPLVNYHKLVLTVSCPDGKVISSTFNSGAAPAYDLPAGALDGPYTYQLSVVPVLPKMSRDGQVGDKTPISQYGPKGMKQSGTFTVKNGNIVPQIQETGPDGTLDNVILDDLIVDGSACIGQDCVNGEAFGFDTIRIKENNLRIKAQDTSNSASFPTRDWQITFNDSSNGGANKFSIDDIDGGRTPFTIEAGAPNHSLYVDDGGRIGLGTSTPTVQVHVVEGNTPTLRLEQDGSSGFTPQTWDVAGNEANFFIRDATNGSTLPFRIFPDAPSDALNIEGSTGDIGIGTTSPTAPLEISAGSSNPALVITSDSNTAALVTAERSGGATVQFSAGGTQTFFGSRSNHPLGLLINQFTTFYMDTSGNIAIGDGVASYTTTGGHKINVKGSGAHLTSGGDWINGSSRAIKDNIQKLSLTAAKQTIMELEPVTYVYKAERDEPNVGFIAEDVPELVAQKGRKGLSSMNILAVVTKVVKDQQKTIKDQSKTIAELSKRLEALEKNSK